MDSNEGSFFSNELMQEIKDRFYYVDSDPDNRERLYFDNAGGSFRLKKAVEQFSKIDSIPDNPERIHQTALFLQEMQGRQHGDNRAGASFRLRRDDLLCE